MQVRAVPRGHSREATVSGHQVEIVNSIPGRMKRAGKSDEDRTDPPKNSRLAWFRLCLIESVAKGAEPDAVAVLAESVMKVVPTRLQATIAG